MRYESPDPMLHMGKDRMREFHQERDAAYLALEARNFQPRRIRATLNQGVSLLMRLVLPLEKRFGLGRIMRRKAITLRHQTALRLTEWGF